MEAQIIVLVQFNASFAGSLATNFELCDRLVVSPGRAVHSNRNATPAVLVPTMPLGGEAATAKRRNGLFPGAQEGASTAATPIHELPLTRASRVNPLLAAAPTSGTATSPSPFPEHYDSIGVTFHRHPAPPQPTNPYSALVDSQSFAVLSSFTLENGVTLKNVEVAFKTWGTMKGQGDAADDGVGNVVVVSHA
jgi:hypothetical protein